MVQNRHTHRTHSVHCSASPGPCAALQSRRPSALLTPSRPAFAVMPLERASNASISPACAVARPKGAVYASPTTSASLNGSTSRHDFHEVLPFAQIPFARFVCPEAAPCFCIHLRRAHPSEQCSCCLGHLARGTHRKLVNPRRSSKTDGFAHHWNSICHLNDLSRARRDYLYACAQAPALESVHVLT